MEITIPLKEILSNSLIRQINDFCSSYFPKELIKFPSIDNLPKNQLDFLLKEMRETFGKEFTIEEIKKDKEISQKVNSWIKSAYQEAWKAQFPQEVYEQLEITLETIHFSNIDDISYEVNTSPNFPHWEIIFTLNGDEKDLPELLMEFFKLEEDDMYTTDGEINVVKRKLLFRKIETDKELRKRFKDFFVKYFGIDDQVESAFREIIKAIEYPQEYDYLNFEIQDNEFKKQIQKMIRMKK